MLITVDNIKKSFGERTLIKNGSFFVDNKDKIGIVGDNGTGKTTLIRMILGEETIDAGSVNISKNIKIGYLSQLNKADNTNSLYEEIILADPYILDLNAEIAKLNDLMSSLTDKDELDKTINHFTRLNEEFEKNDGYTYFSRAKSILKGLGFDENEFDKKTDMLSGGELTRLTLGKLLLSRNQILILDEPTNHLDMDSIEWLEGFLSDYEGALILISHDRYFMDKIVTKIVELKDKTLRTYQGNYSVYAKKQEQIRLAYIKAYENQQREIRHQEEVISKLKSFNREKSIKRAESREKQLKKIDRLERLQDDSVIKMRFDTKRLSSLKVLTVNDLSKSYDNSVVFKNVNFDISRGEKVALIGNNGVGKTTILKIINGFINDFNGEIRFGENLDIAYFEQNAENMNLENTVFGEISESFPSYTNTKIRNALASFLFTGDDVFKNISSLSGGERGRVALVKLMLSGANFIILDEPTNHLDIASKEILETALNSYEGTIFYVSHDRFFINKTASRILKLSENGVSNYLGNYDYYVEKNREHQLSVQISNSTKELSKSADDWKNEKQRQSDKRKTENRIKKLEEDISVYEDKLRELEGLLMRDEIASDSVKCFEVSREHEEIQKLLDEVMTEWIGLQS